MQVRVLLRARLVGASAEAVCSSRTELQFWRPWDDYSALRDAKVVIVPAKTRYRRGMSMPNEPIRSATGRREPPPFRPVSLIGRTELSPRMIRVTLGGPNLAGLTVDQPAASVRLLLPPPGADDLVVPLWNGNEFLLPDGSRPLIRTFTPRRFDPDELHLDLDLVIHDGGVASGWAQNAPLGAGAAVSGTGRGYVIDMDASEYVLVGDETALPAIAQLLEEIPSTVPIRVLVEVADPAVRIALPDHPHAVVEWLDLPAGRSVGGALIDAVERAVVDPAAKLWCAGEAAAMHALRTHLFRERGFSRSQATIRGYWKARG